MLLFSQTSKLEGYVIHVPTRAFATRDDYFTFLKFAKDHLPPLPKSPQVGRASQPNSPSSLI
jgi:hypothetical protein